MLQQALHARADGDEAALARDVHAAVRHVLPLRRVVLARDVWAVVVEERANVQDLVHAGDAKLQHHVVVQALRVANVALEQEDGQTLEVDARGVEGSLVEVCAHQVHRVRVEVLASQGAALDDVVDALEKLTVATAHVCDVGRLVVEVRRVEDAADNVVDIGKELLVLEPAANHVEGTINVTLFFLLLALVVRFFDGAMLLLLLLLCEDGGPLSHEFWEAGEHAAIRGCGADNKGAFADEAPDF